MIGKILYSTLVITGMTLLWLSYKKTKDKLVFPLFFALSGCIALFDYIIYVWGIAYVYKPGFLNNEIDKQVGALISDFFSVPACAVFITAFRLRWYWAVLIDLIYFGIEELFLKVGIYEQFWWKTWYTFVLLLVLFWIANVWYSKLNQSHGRVISYATLISALLVIKLVFYIFIQGIFETRELISEWIKSLERQGPVIYSPVSLITAVTFSILILRNSRKIWMLFAIIVFYLLDFALKKAGIIQALTFWDNAYVVLSDTATLMIGMYFAHLLKMNEQVKYSNNKEYGQYK